MDHNTGCSNGVNCWCEILESDTVEEPKIHVRVQQRNARHSLTTIEGLNRSLDHKRMLKFMKKNLNCNGSIVKSTEHGTVIQLQGDQRNGVSTILTTLELCSADQLVIHGG